MSLQPPLDADREAQAQELVRRLRAAADSELLALARLLVGKEEHEIFGETEFQGGPVNMIAIDTGQVPYRACSISNRNSFHTCR